MLSLLPRAPKSVRSSVVHAQLLEMGFKTTKRTVERDLIDLQSRFNLEVDTSQMTHLWCWSKDALPLELPRMSRSEALTLLMVKEHLHNLVPSNVFKQMARYFDLAAQQLNEAHGKRNGRISENDLQKLWHKKVRLVPANQPLLCPNIDEDVLSQIQDALLDGMQCEVAYQKKLKDQTVSYVIHPLALVQRGVILYLVCTIKHYKDIKLLAVHRIKSAKETTLPATGLVGFDLDDYIASAAFGWRAEGQKVSLEVLFTSDAVLHLMETPLSRDQEHVIQADGRVLLVASVMETPQLLWWLLGFGDSVEVVAPIALRNRLAAIAKGMFLRYVDN